MGHGDDARRRAHYVDHVPFPASGAQRVPVSIEGAHGNWNPGRQPHLRCPCFAQSAVDVVGGQVLSADLLPYALQQRIDGYQKVLRRKASPLRVPHPLVSHGADTALQLCRSADTGQCRGNHIAMFQRSGESGALRILGMPQPVQQLGPAPFMGVDATAPVNRFQFPLMSLRGDLLGLAMGAMIAPQVIVVQRLQRVVHHHHAGTGRIQRHRQHIFAPHARLLQHASRGLYQRVHLVGVRLGREVRIFPPPMKRILRNRGSQPTTF